MKVGCWSGISEYQQLSEISDIHLGTGTGSAHGFSILKPAVTLQNEFLFSWERKQNPARVQARAPWLSVFEGVAAPI